MSVQKCLVLPPSYHLRVEHVCPEPRRHSPPPPCRLYLGQVVAEAEAAAAVQTELAQSHNAGRALREATAVISLDGGRDQGIEVLLAGQIYGRVS